MLLHMELDQNVAWPSTAVKGGAGAAGDNLVYTSDGDKTISGTRRIRAWLRANQIATVKLQVPDGAGGFITINNGGAGDATVANTWFDINYLRPAGAHQLVINFATLPTTYQHPPAFRMTAFP